MAPPEDIRNKVSKILAAAVPDTPPAASTTSLLPVLTVTAIIIVVSALAYGAYAYASKPRGEITSPAYKTQTSRLVTVEGFTKNIPTLRRHLWVAVDINSLGQCWPKREIFKANASFSTIIYEGGPGKEFTVSLYAVDRDYNDRIMKWFDEVRATGSEIGMPMLPEEYRLDFVGLVLR